MMILIGRGLDLREKEARRRERGSETPEGVKRKRAKAEHGKAGREGEGLRRGNRREAWDPRGGECRTFQVKAKRPMVRAAAPTRPVRF